MGRARGCTKPPCRGAAAPSAGVIEDVLSTAVRSTYLHALSDKKRETASKALRAGYHPAKFQTEVALDTSFDRSFSWLDALGLTCAGRETAVSAAGRVQVDRSHRF
jgi:hypothetical protein